MHPTPYSPHMANVSSQIITAVAGAGVGALISWLLARAADMRRLKAEDDRRWLADRRSAYVSFLGVIESMLRDLEELSASYGGSPEPLPAEDQKAYDEGMAAHHRRWAHELYPAFGHVRLIASLPVVELAERLAGFGGEMEHVGVVFEEEHTVQAYLRGMNRARDVISELLAAMRVELGFPLPLRGGAIGPGMRTRMNWSACSKSTVRRKVGRALGQEAGVMPFAGRRTRACRRSRRTTV
jgi:hypothetical protein